jgi:hypothetical protein
MTPIELRNKGYQALIEKLGLIDALRFLQQAPLRISEKESVIYTTKKRKIRERKYAKIKE